MKNAPTIVLGVGLEGILNVSSSLSNRIMHY